MLFNIIVIIVVVIAIVSEHLYSAARRFRGATKSVLSLANNILFRRFRKRGRGRVTSKGSAPSRIAHKSEAYGSRNKTPNRAIALRMREQPKVLW